MARDKAGNTPMHFVGFDSHSVPWVKLLLRNGAEITAKRKDRSAPIHVAAKETTNIDPAIIDLILDCNVPDARGNTTLHLIINSGTVSGREEAIKCRLKAGADVNRKNHDGVTPLHVEMLSGKKCGRHNLLACGCWRRLESP